MTGSATERLRPHVGYLAGLLALALLLGWLTLAQGRLDGLLLGYVTLLGVGYRWAATSRRFSRRSREALVFAIVGGGLMGLLAILSGGSLNYIVFLLITILIFALFALGLNLEYGFTGIINFGHVAFMGIGAYVTTLLSRAWLPRVPEVAASPAASLLLVAGSALLLLLVGAVLGSAGAEALLVRLRPAWDPRQRARFGLWAGGASGTLAAGALLVAVPHPLDAFWAGAYLIGATVLLGMLGAAAFGLLLGIPTLRLRADYLAIVTIGAAEILRRFWLNEQWLTDGPRGVVGFPLPFAQASVRWEWLVSLSALLGVGNPYKMLLLLLVTACLLLTYGLYEILVRAPYGRVLKAIREDEQVAAALGKNVFLHKLQALAIGSAVAALSGSLLAWHRVYVSPSTFLPLFTFYAWIIVVLGGLGNNRGTILGAVILYAFFEATRFLDLDGAIGITSTQGAALRVALIGALLVLFMMFKPEGILGRREEMVLGR